MVTKSKAIAEDPLHVGIAVRAGPRAITITIRVRQGRGLDQRGEIVRRRRLPVMENPTGSAAHASFGRQQIAVQVPPRGATRTRGLPDFPTITPPGPRDDKPMMMGKPSNDGNARRAQLYDACMIAPFG